VGHTTTGRHQVDLEPVFVGVEAAAVHLDIPNAGRRHVADGHALVVGLAGAAHGGPLRRVHPQVEVAAQVPKTNRDLGAEAPLGAEAVPVAIEVAGDGGLAAVGHAGHH